MPVPISDFAPVLHSAEVSSPAPRRVEAVPATAFDVQASATDVSFGELVAISEVMPQPASLELVPLSASRGSEVAFNAPLQPEPIATMAMLTEQSTMSVDHDRDGFLTGAVKRTGTSIARTSMKTGSSIWDAIRAVPGFVRKALPN